MNRDWEFLLIKGGWTAFFEFTYAFTDECFRIMSEINRCVGCEKISVAISAPDPSYFAESRGAEQSFSNFSDEYGRWAEGNAVLTDPDAPMYRADAIEWRGKNWLCRGLRAVNLCSITIINETEGGRQIEFLLSERRAGMIRSINEIEFVESEFLRNEHFKEFMSVMRSFYMPY